MTKPNNNGRAGMAVLVGVATAVAGYLPAAYVWDRLRSLISPMRHAEEAMGRGLEVIFIAGPLGALCLAAIAGWLTYRSTSRTPLRWAIAFMVGCALASVAIARWARLL